MAKPTPVGTSVDNGSMDKEYDECPFCDRLFEKRGLFLVDPRTGEETTPSVMEHHIRGGHHIKEDHHKVLLLLDQGTGGETTSNLLEQHIKKDHHKVRVWKGRNAKWIDAAELKRRLAKTGQPVSAK